MDTTESDYYQFMDFDADNARSVLSYYTQFFSEGPVLELASGPGVFLTLLREAGIDATGVDIDEGMIEVSTKAGHTAVLGDAVAHLRALPDSSQAGLFAAHFLEHLPAERVQEVYEQAARVLRPGGRFVAAVPNAACLSILGYDFWRDPTHVRFYDPVALQFFARQAGLVVVGTGGNPNNHPGSPPHLRSQPPRTAPAIGSEVNTLVQHAQWMVQNRRNGKSAARTKGGSSDPSEDQIWAELGHVLATFDNGLQTLQHELASVRTAYENLLTQLYPPNEVFVAAEKRAEVNGATDRAMAQSTRLDSD